MNDRYDHFGRDRVIVYRDDIESLRSHLKHTSWKDNDVRAEIKQEIAELESEIAKWLNL